MPGLRREVEEPVLLGERFEPGELFRPARDRPLYGVRKCFRACDFSAKNRTRLKSWPRIHLLAIRANVQVTNPQLYVLYVRTVAKSSDLYTFLTPHLQKCTPDRTLQLTRGKPKPAVRGPVEGGFTPPAA